MRLLWRTEMGDLDPWRLVFVDEMGVHTSLAPIYAYAPVGERAFFEIPRNRGRNNRAAVEPSLRRDRAFHGRRGRDDHQQRVFEAYVERLLAPTLRPGQVVVMDNLGAHRPKRVRELVEGRGCELVYLPAYSPDLNPIEEAFSKVKHILRKIAARTKEDLVEAMGAALSAVSDEAVRGFFAHCGYHTPAQQL